MSERDDLDLQLSAWIDGELPEAEARELAERVARDPELAARRDRLARVDDALRALDAPALPGDLRARLDARLAQSEAARIAPTGPRRRRWAIPAAAALAAGVALYLAAVSRPPRVLPTPEPAPPPVADTEPEPADALPIDADDAELAVAFEYDLLRDFDVIDRLDELEALAAYEDARRSDRS